jgi:hypothetical protein
VILEEGVHKFKCESPSFNWASVSAPALTKIEVKVNGELRDKTYAVGPTHTWWSNNSMFEPPLKDGDEVEISIDGPGAMRLECVGLKKVEA